MLISLNQLRHNDGLPVDQKFEFIVSYVHHLGVSIMQLSVPVCRNANHVVFDSETPHILARAATTKNRLDSRIPMTKELERKLLKHRPKTFRPNHPVFAKGVPRARTLRLDLEKAGIPYKDEMGRYADFHSLRYTWGTYLQRNGVNSRVAMELMRHSDRKLTDKIYTDSNLLPLGEVVRNLPDEGPLTNILTNISGKMGRNGSRVDEIEPLEKAAKTALHAASGLELSQSGDSESLVEVAVIEPAWAVEGTPANKRVAAHSTEALINILTNLLGSDRQML
ncbi:tyrosine-type recombinase/integrase [Opitutales bacterium]|nr:tyrosine-type recombinase/integrase [Opitutales bacterium]